jgi:hypothetical protein
LLPSCRERPLGRAAKKRDKIAPPRSITSAARSSSFFADESGVIIDASEEYTPNQVTA